MRQRIDSLAQQVEHNTFNVGVLGSSPKRITKERPSVLKAFSFLFSFIFSCFLFVLALSKSIIFVLLILY